MEMAKNNAFVDLSDNEMMQVDGGLGFWAGLAVGFCVDGVVIALTSKSCGEWVATGIKAGTAWVKSW